MKDGRPAYAYNLVGMEHTALAASKPLPAGKATIVLDFNYEGGGLGKGGTAILSVNGQKVAEGRIARTTPFVFSLDEGADVGMDEDTPVSDDYKQGDNAFTGRIVKVTVQTKAPADADASQQVKRKTDRS
jgi:arylsulfatase